MALSFAKLPESYLLRLVISYHNMSVLNNPKYLYIETIWKAEH